MEPVDGGGPRGELVHLPKFRPGVRNLTHNSLINTPAKGIAPMPFAGKGNFYLDLFPERLQRHMALWGKPSVECILLGKGSCLFCASPGLSAEESADQANHRGDDGDKGRANDPGNACANRAVTLREGVIRQESSFILNGGRCIRGGAGYTEIAFIQSHIPAVAILRVAEQRPLQPIRVGTGRQGQSAANYDSRGGENRQRCPQGVSPVLSGRSGRAS